MARLRSFKKPRSMVPGDIFPQLVTNYAVSLSEPLEKIYGEVFASYHWPLCWRNEYVTIIPKGLDPEDLGNAVIFRVSKKQGFWNIGNASPWK